MNDPYHLVGTTLGNRYRLENVAGAGGMSLVYRGRDTTSDALIAVKVLDPKLLLRQSDLYLRLFAQEVKAAQSLVHPNILSILDSGFDRDVAFLVMEWLEGRTVGEELEDIGRFPLGRAALVLEQVCNALNVAHDRKIIHLDIKPNNIFLLNTKDGRDIIKVIDFGLARIIQSTAGTTVSRYVGTPYYSAPELFRNKASRLSDIYSLGVTAFEMLTGLRPFSHSQINAVIYQHLEQPPPSLRISSPEIPQLVDDLIGRAMNKRPSARPKNAVEFRDDLLAALRWSEKGGKVGWRAESDNAHLTSVSIRKANRPTRLRASRLRKAERVKGRRGDYLGEVESSLIRMLAYLKRLASSIYANPLFFLYYRLRFPLKIVLALSLLIVLYPFPKLIGLSIERFHGGLIAGAIFFLMGLGPYRLPATRFLMRRLMLSIWLVSCGMIVIPPKLLGSNLSRVHGCFFWLSSVGCFCWTHKIKVTNNRNEVIEIRPLETKILGTVAILLGVCFALYAWLR